MLGHRFTGTFALLVDLQMPTTGDVALHCDQTCTGEVAELTQVDAWVFFGPLVVQQSLMHQALAVLQVPGLRVEGSIADPAELVVGC